MKSINVTEENHQYIMMLKIRMKHKNVSETLEYLLKVANESVKIGEKP